MQKEITKFQKGYDDYFCKILEKQSLSSAEIKKNIKQKIAVCNRRAQMELEKSLKDTKRIGNELLIELDKEIDKI